MRICAENHRGQNYLWEKRVALWTVNLVFHPAGIQLSTHFQHFCSGFLHRGKQQQTPQFVKQRTRLAKLNSSDPLSPVHTDKKQWNTVCPKDKAQLNKF